MPDLNYLPDLIIDNTTRNHTISHPFHFANTDKGNPIQENAVPRQRSILAAPEKCRAHHQCRSYPSKAKFRMTATTSVEDRSVGPHQS